MEIYVFFIPAKIVSLNSSFLSVLLLMKLTESWKSDLKRT